MKYCDRAGRPLSLMRWAALLEDPAYRRVALDTVADCTVSTVWLGLRYDDDRPEIFETAVISDSGDTQLLQRWLTEAEAVDGHRQAVAHLRNLEKKLEGRS